jgi:phosphocarrier protein FPr
VTGPVGLVAVSHSRALAEAAVALAREMAAPDQPIEVAAGADDGGFGTDAVAIAAAIGAADRGAGVVVVMDLGSAVLSAELALELLDDPALADAVVLCPAPFVEGLVVAAVAAAGGADRAEVAAEAAGALAGKASQLGGPAPAEEEPVPEESVPEEGAGAVGGAFVVADPHGLHARPAARLVAVVREHPDARVRLRNATTGSGWVPAGSLSRVATLGALRGHRVEVAAEGPAADAALRAVLDLHAAEPATRPTGPPPAAVPPGGTLGLSGGVAVGPAHPLDSRVPVPDEPSRGSAEEAARLDAALAAVGREIDATAPGTGPGSDEAAAIFGAHRLLLDDPDLVDPARAAVAAGAPAPRAWADAVAATARAFAALPDPYLAGRAADVEAVGEQVLRELVGAPPPAPAPPGAVVVAADLTPAQVVALDTGVAGVVLAGGAATAHAAILLRARGLPAVGGAGSAVLDLAPGTPVALDGGTGELVLDPPPDVVAAFRARAADRAAAARRAAERSGEPAVTRSGIRVLVGVNAGSAADAAAGAAQGADLVGLLRTEFLFLDRGAAPDVDEQEAAYRAVAEAVGGRRVTLRTIDVGGDKPLPYLPLPAEANPFLGLRGIRLARLRPDLLADQLLAAVRVAHDTPLSIMFPMVAVLDELLDARRALEEAVAREGRGAPAGLQVGMMVEVPAAALAAAEFAPHVDFFSIGTNDLVQYALAAERGNPAVAHLADPLHPGVLGLVEAVGRAAGERVLVAVCGEAAADPRAAARFVDLGVRELSVAAPAVPGTKEAVRELDRPRG